MAMTFSERLLYYNKFKVSWTCGEKKMELLALSSFKTMEHLSVLLIEPNPLLQTRMQERLSEFASIGSIFLADSFAKGFPILREHYPDILILDSSLTNHLGLALLTKMVKEKFRFEIIILSNTPADYYKEYCHGLGIHYILDKSLELDLLPVIIEEIGHEKMH